VAAEHVALLVHDLPFPNEMGEVGARIGAGVTGRREAELLRIGLRRDGQAETLGERACFRLGELADREERPGERALAEHVEHVRLVLPGIEPSQQAPAVAGVVPRPPHVMPARHHVDAELVGAAQERAELDLAVAARARVRRSARLVLRGEVREHGAIEFVGQIADLEREPGDPRGLFRVAPRARTATSVVYAVQVHEPHVRAQHVVALFVQQACGDRGIDAAGHRDQHGWHAVRLSATRLTTRRHDRVRSPRPYRGGHARSTIRRPHRRLAVVPARGTGRGARSDARR
jgi:hypothetical protein